MMKAESAYRCPSPFYDPKRRLWILLVKDGSIIEQGTYDDLIAKGGFYHTLYNSQFAKVSE